MPANARTCAVAADVRASTDGMVSQLDTPSPPTHSSSIARRSPFLSLVCLGCPLFLMAAVWCELFVFRLGEFDVAEVRPPELRFALLTCLLVVGCCLLGLWFVDVCSCDMARDRRSRRGKRAHGKADQKTASSRQATTDRGGRRSGAFRRGAGTGSRGSRTRLGSSIRIHIGSSASFLVLFFFFFCLLLLECCCSFLLFCSSLRSV